MGPTLAATFLITDLVGSTALASSKPPAEAEAFRKSYFGLLRDAVAGTGGIEVKSMGDGIMVIFTSPSRALACAVEMQQAVERHNRLADPQLKLRIGLSTGEVVEDEGDYYGDAVIEAVRLCALAEGGQILAAELVRALAGRMPSHDFASVGALELKGLPDPVPTLSVLWEPTPNTHAPNGESVFPARLLGAASGTVFPFCGRAVELDRLAAAAKRCSADARLEVVLIAAEPGMGKTALAAQAARAAHAAGALVCYGASEEDLAVPYQAWIAALGALAERIGEDELQRLASTDAPQVLGRFLPRRAGWPSPAPPATTDPETERFLLFEAVVSLLAAGSTGTPLVVVIDDLHWADVATLQLLHHIVVSAVPMRVLVIGTYRDSDLSRTHPLTSLLADLRREPSVSRIELHGLEDSELIELMEVAAGYELPEAGVALAHALRAETGGNPFYSTEILRHLAETGTFYLGTDGRYSAREDPAGIGLPGSVREVVGRRVARLGDETLRTLSLASVIGQVFDVPVLASLAECTEATLLDVLDGATAAALVAEVPDQPGRYGFVHALIQHTLYEDLSAARRQRAHQRVALILESLGEPGVGRVAELARHWMAATQPADLGKAFRYARQAADGAMAALAPADAVRWYTQALDIHDRQMSADEGERCELLIALGLAESQSGIPAYRETLLQAAAMARRNGDSAALVAAALANTRGYSSFVEVDPERVSVLEAALDAVGDRDTGDRARLLAVLSGQTNPLDWRRRRDVASEAVAVARRLGDGATLLATLTTTYGSRAQPDTLAARVGETAEEVALADSTGDPVARCLARYNRLHTCLEASGLEPTGLAKVDQTLDEMGAIVVVTALPYLQQLVLLSRCWRTLLAGDPAEAEVIANEVLQVGTRIGQPEVFSLFGAQLFLIRHEQGRLDEIADLLADAAQQNPTIPSLRAAVTDLYCELGRTDAARTEFARDADNGFSAFPYDLVWLTSMVRCADNAASLGDRDAAGLLYDRLAPYGNMIAANPATVVGAVARPLGRVAGLLGRFDEAETHLRVALDIHERIAAPYWTSRTQLDFAELLSTRDRAGDRSLARELIRAAQRTADERGYGGLLRRVRQLSERV